VPVHLDYLKQRPQVFQTVNGIEFIKRGFSSRNYGGDGGRNVEIFN